MDDRLTFGTDAHVNAPDENPLDHIGDEIPDPWNDPDQTDWATETLVLDGVV